MNHAFYPMVLASGFWSWPFHYGALWLLGSGFCLSAAADPQIPKKCAALIMQSPPSEAWSVSPNATGFHVLLTTTAALGPGAQGPERRSCLNACVCVCVCVCVWSRERSCRGRLVTPGDMLEVQDRAPLPTHPHPGLGPTLDETQDSGPGCSWGVSVSQSRD